MEIQVQSSPQTKSAEIVASTVDVLAEILLRLPVKSVLRFKLVSKRWFQLISDPRFCQLLHPNPNPAVGLFLPLSAANSGKDHQCHGYEFVPFHSGESVEFIKHHLPSDVRILQSCNGLILCRRMNNITHDDDPEYFVHNPTTKKFSILPKPDQTNGIWKRIRGINLAFDPAESFHYKIVLVYSLGSHQQQAAEPESHFQIMVYSSVTSSWLVHSQSFTSPADFGKGVYWNHAIHWMATVGNARSLYFNVESRTLCNTPLLPITYSSRCKRDHYFGESCGHLHFIDMRGPQVRLVVYELRRDYSEWFGKYKVDLSAVVVANPTMASSRGNPMFWCRFVFEVLAVVRGEEDGDSFLVLQIPGKVVRYNVVCKSFEDLVEFRGGIVRSSLKYPNVVGFQYIQSLCWA